MAETSSVGYVYVLSNKSHLLPQPKLKIGMTTDVSSRLKSLYTTSVPDPFDIEYLLKFDNGEYTRVEKLIHLIFAPQRYRDDREFFIISFDQIRALIDLLKLCGVEEVDPSEYRQSRPASVQKNVISSNNTISKGHKDWFERLLETLLKNDDRERKQKMKQTQKKSYLAPKSLSQIITGLGEKINDFKRAIDVQDNSSVNKYCCSLLYIVDDPYSKAFVKLIKYHYQ